PWARAPPLQGRNDRPHRDRRQRRGLPRPRARGGTDAHARMTADGLATWNDGPVRERIVEFVERVSQEGGRDYVPPSDRIAVFDNDGTLWCEKPMPIELGFILTRLVEMAEHDETLRTRQPWQAAYRRDYAWLGEAVTKHYRGDDGDVKVLIGG